MNKLAILLAFLLTSCHEANADKKGYFYGIKFDHKNSANANTFGVDYGKHVYDWLDIKVSTNHTDKKDTSRLEIGPKFKYKINENLSSSLHLATGQKFVKDDDFGYWVMTPEVKYKINQDWSVGSSIRFRDSYDAKLEQNDTTYSIKLDTKLFQDYTLSTRYRMKRGDSEYNAIGIGLKYEF